MFSSKHDSVQHLHPNPSYVEFQSRTRLGLKQTDSCSSLLTAPAKRTMSKSILGSELQYGQPHRLGHFNT